MIQFHPLIKRLSNNQGRKPATKRAGLHESAPITISSGFRSSKVYRGWPSIISAVCSRPGVFELSLSSTVLKIIYQRKIESSAP